MRLIRTIFLIGLCAVFVHNASSVAVGDECGPLPKNVSNMTVKQLDAEKARLLELYDEKAVKTRVVEAKLESWKRLHDYKKFGDAKQKEDCAAEFRAHSEARKTYEAMVRKKQRISEKFVAEYEKRRLAYRYCMDAHIRADDSFRSLLENDRGAEKLRKKLTDKKKGKEEVSLYSLDVAYGRYNELKASLMPKGQTRAGPIEQKLKDELKDLEECKKRLTLARDELEQEKAAQAVLEVLKQSPK